MSLSKADPHPGCHVSKGCSAGSSLSLGPAYIENAYGRLTSPSDAPVGRTRECSDTDPGNRIGCIRVRLRRWFEDAIRLAGRIDGA